MFGMDVPTLSAVASQCLAGWESERSGPSLLLGQTLRPGLCSRVPLQVSWKPFSVGLMLPISPLLVLFPFPVLLRPLSGFSWEHYLKYCLCTSLLGGHPTMAPSYVSLWSPGHYSTDQDVLQVPVLQPAPCTGQGAF